ncbi:hypothetical protein GCM10018771_50450 [Streptomyces cellulosae]|nr:hypothetical protein GCM10018771_50450 [Streptomyces cellulosae]
MKLLGIVISGRSTPAGVEAAAEVDGLEEPASAPSMSSEESSPPQPVSSKAVVAVSAAAVMVKARRATDDSP